jgi:hypothetical protein
MIPGQGSGTLSCAVLRSHNLAYILTRLRGNASTETMPYILGCDGFGNTCEIQTVDFLIGPPRPQRRPCSPIV